MNGKLLILALAIFSANLDFTLSSSIRVERETDTDTCEDVVKSHAECIKSAYDDYNAAFEKGDDGRPDWMARKSCNYLTSSVEDCGNKLLGGECYSEDDVNEMKDQQLNNVLKQLQTSIEEW